jgi:hypothetical protein
MGMDTNTQSDVPIFSRFNTSDSTSSGTASTKRPRLPLQEEKQLRIKIGTYNANGQAPGDIDVEQWLHIKEDEPDILVVGLQEAENSNFSYVVWTPYVVDAWSGAVISSMGTSANHYTKVSREGESRMMQILSGPIFSISAYI